MGAGLGGFVHQHLAIRKDNRLGRHRGLVERKDELLVLPRLVLEGKAIDAICTLAKTIGGLVDLLGCQVLAGNVQADLAGIVHEVEVAANQVLDGRTSSDLVDKLGLELIEVGIKLAAIGIPGEILQEDLAIEVSSVLVVDVHVVTGVDHRLEGVIGAPKRDIVAAGSVYIDGNGVRSSDRGCRISVLVVVLGPVFVGILVLIAIVRKILTELLRALHGLREDEVGVVGKLLPGVVSVVLAGLPLPNAAHHVPVAFYAAKRPRVRLGIVAILAVEIRGAIANQDHVLVLGLNGSVSVEHALGGKKAGIHVGAGVNA